MLQRLNPTCSLVIFLLAEQLPDLFGRNRCFKSAAVSFKEDVNSARKYEALTPRR